MTFQAGGSLWKEALVLQDIETKSLWSQVTGECIAGDMKGESLPLYPVSMTTYAEFKKQYPDGKLLVKPNKGPDKSPCDPYFNDKTSLGTFGRIDNFQRLKGKDMVYGLRHNGKQVALSQDYLMRNRFAVLNQFVPPVLVAYDSTTSSVSAFSLIDHAADADSFLLHDDTITFNPNQYTWHARTGQLLSGEANNLPSFPITSAYWFAWVGFFPETELIK